MLLETMVGILGWSEMLLPVTAVQRVFHDAAIKGEFCSFHQDLPKPAKSSINRKGEDDCHKVPAEDGT